MADKTMPPVSENLDAPAMDAPMAMPEDMAPPAAPEGDGGSVMVTIPEPAFKAMHQIVMQLASGLDELAKGVAQQAAGQAAPVAEAEVVAEGAPSDEEFLSSMAEEGSARSR